MVCLLGQFSKSLDKVIKTGSCMHWLVGRESRSQKQVHGAWLISFLSAICFIISSFGVPHFGLLVENLAG